MQNTRADLNSIFGSLYARQSALKLAKKVYQKEEYTYCQMYKEVAKENIRRLAEEVEREEMFQLSPVKPDAPNTEKETTDEENTGWDLGDEISEEE